MNTRMDDCSICGRGEGEVSAIVDTLLYQSNVKIGICNECLNNMNTVAISLLDEKIKKNESLVKQTRQPKLVLVK